MKTKLTVLAFLIMAAMLPIGGSANSSQERSVLVTFSRATVFYDSLLQGQYLVVHDESAMHVSGAHCTRIYRYQDGHAGSLVTSFRCVPRVAEMAKQAKFSFVSGSTTSGKIADRVSGFQMAGEAEIHGVP